MGRFLNGLLLGVGVGLLVAPEKGEDIRANLADASNRWRDQLNRLLGRGGARLDDLRNFLDSEIEGMTDDSRGKISKILDELAPDGRQQGGGQGAAGGREETAGATQGQREPARNSGGQRSGQRQTASASQSQGQMQEAGNQQSQQEGRQQQGSEGRQA